MTYQEAWQRAQDAWGAAGKTLPCHEPRYMASRSELAKVLQLNSKKKR